MLDALATHDVLNLAAAEVILCRESLSRLLIDFGHHGTPNFRLDLLLRLMELDAEKETALEGLVEGTGHITGANHDAVEFLHLFEKDVLHTVVHLPHCIASALLIALAQDGITLVEEQNGTNFALGDQ